MVSSPAGYRQLPAKIIWPSWAMMLLRICIMSFQNVLDGTSCAIQQTTHAPGGIAGGRFPSLSSSTSWPSSTSCEEGIGFGSLSLRISPSFSVSLFFFSGGFMLSVRIEKRRRMLQPAWSHSVFLAFRLSLLQILSRLRRLSLGKFVRDFEASTSLNKLISLMPAPFSRRRF